MGGAVRDRLLGQPVKENDYVVVGALPGDLLKQGYIQVGKDFPVFLHPETREEYALARTERKKGPGYTGFSVYADPKVTLLEDLRRRDLTINAIAETRQGEIIDPYGGRYDIQKKILRHVSPAFAEDPVRILRIARFMARFASLGFKIAPETLSLMRTMVQNKEVNALVPERIWREFERALSEPSPSEFIVTLNKCGAWGCICPEWKHVSSKRYRHALMTLNTVSVLTNDTKIRFASFIQFLALNAEDTQPIEHLVNRWRIPKAYRDLLMLSIKYRDTVHHFSHLNAEQILGLVERVDALRRRERFEQFLTLCEADCRVQSLHNTSYAQKAQLLSLVDSLRTLDISPLLGSGLKGIPFRKALRERQLAMVEKKKKAFDSTPN